MIKYITSNADKIYKIDKIKKALAFSCINANPQSFIPFLLSKNVTTQFPNKARFYSFFKSMLEPLKQFKKGELILKVEPFGDDKFSKLYNFYDSRHKYARLTMIVKESNNKIYLDVSPI